MRGGGKLRRRVKNGRPYRDPRRAGTQSEKYKRGRAFERDRRDRGRIRFGKIFARAGRALCGGVAPLSRSAFHVYAAAHDAGGKGAGGRDFVRSRGARAAPAPRRAGDTQHVRHGHGTSEQPAAHVFAPGEPPLPERALPSADARRRRGKRTRLPRMRRKVLRAVRGGTRLQQQRRLPDVRGDGDRAYGRQEHARARRRPDHRRGRGRAMEHAHVVSDDGRVPRDGRAHGRAVQRPDGQGKGHRVQRPCRKEAYPVPREKFGRRHRTRFHVL